MGWGPESDQSSGYRCDSLSMIPSNDISFYVGLSNDRPRPHLSRRLPRETPSINMSAMDCSYHINRTIPLSWAEDNTFLFILRGPSFKIIAFPTPTSSLFRLGQSIIRSLSKPSCLTAIMPGLGADGPAVALSCKGHPLLRFHNNEKVSTIDESF